MALNAVAGGAEDLGGVLAGGDGFLEPALFRELLPASERVLGPDHRTTLPPG
jgi:hypothetical protein